MPFNAYLGDRLIHAKHDPYATSNWDTWRGLRPSKRPTFTCKCGQPVYPKTSNRRTPFFCHYSTEAERACPYTDPETEAHWTIKTAVAAAYDTLGGGWQGVVEHVIHHDGDTRRLDAAALHPQQRTWATEVQVTPQNTATIRRRATDIVAALEPGNPKRSAWVLAYTPDTPAWEHLPAVTVGRDDHRLTTTSPFFVALGVTTDNPPTAPTIIKGLATGRYDWISGEGIGTRGFHARTEQATTRQRRRLNDSLEATGRSADCQRTAITVTVPELPITVTATKPRITATELDGTPRPQGICDHCGSVTAALRQWTVAEVTGCGCLCHTVRKAK